MWIYWWFCYCDTQTWRLHPSFPQSHLMQFKPSNQSRTAYPDDILSPPTSPSYPKPQWLQAVLLAEGTVIDSCGARKRLLRLCDMTRTFLASSCREEREPGQVTPLSLSLSGFSAELFGKIMFLFVWCVFSSVVCFVKMLACLLLSGALGLCFVVHSLSKAK